PGGVVDPGPLRHGDATGDAPGPPAAALEAVDEAEAADEVQLRAGIGALVQRDAVGLRDGSVARELDEEVPDEVHRALVAREELPGELEELLDAALEAPVAVGPVRGGGGAHQLAVHSGHAPARAA